MISSDAKVAVIGLGDMGSALARAFLNQGKDVNVWNRTPEKAAPLRQMGATALPTVGMPHRNWSTALFRKRRTSSDGAFHQESGCVSEFPSVMAILSDLLCLITAKETLSLDNRRHFAVFSETVGWTNLITIPLSH